GLGVVVPAVVEDPGVAGQRFVRRHVLGEQHPTIGIFYAGRSGSERGQDREGELAACPLGNLPWGEPGGLDAPQHCVTDAGHVRALSFLTRPRTVDSGTSHCFAAARTDLPPRTSRTASCRLSSRCSLRLHFAIRVSGTGNPSACVTDSGALVIR